MYPYSVNFTVWSIPKYKDQHTIYSMLDVTLSVYFFSVAI